ncbi:carbohydrate-binding domain-containing protein [Acidaminobacter sp. JC074]|uniref:carbohydrate-binding domain-containing protein n=1 Tax=Acidaminobacter sp. JC074 TaxID=2530199 RepID=UPI001F0E461C|nr:carbohydrate-binding domain-containing protein [Acidaminobacter sp. JC074]MCH4887923.1 carbohydrate-binding domain-containing protein [Acidaminobacter sp. JC074]
MKKILLVLVAIILLTGCQSQALEENIESQPVITVLSKENNESTPVEIEDDMFTQRDLLQTYDASEAVYIELTDSNEIIIDQEGTYVFTGQSENTSIVVDVEDEKVQVVLDGVQIINDNQSIINVISADKVFITSVNENVMIVEEAMDEAADAVIFSKGDLVFNGTGSLDIQAPEGNGVDSKDDLKITGSNLNIISEGSGIEANDSIRIADGNISITSNKDGLHSENNSDDTLGNIYISGGTFMISASDDAIRAKSYLQIDGGDIQVETSSEGLEATQVIINDGNIKIYSTDDGINATQKSSLDVMFQVNGGQIDIEMALGDTDGFDSNGDLYINGGVISVNAVSAFDADGTAELNGGEVTVNNELVTELSMQQGRKKR